MEPLTKIVVYSIVALILSMGYQYITTGSCPIIFIGEVPKK